MITRHLQNTNLKDYGEFTAFFKTAENGAKFCHRLQVNYSQENVYDIYYSTSSEAIRTVTKPITPGGSRIEMTIRTELDCAIQSLVIACGGRNTL